MAITFWRNVQRKITTQEMDASFDTLVNDIANAGLSSEMPEGTIYIGDNTNTASLETLDTSIVPETTDKRYQSDLQDTYNDATASIQTQLNSKYNQPSGTTIQYVAGDGSLITFPTLLQADRLVTEVRNTTGSTLTIGTVVYINGATGNKPTVEKAKADSPTTSNTTFGLLQANLSNNSNGYVIVSGNLIGFDTSAWVEGTQLYLSPTTDGTMTSTKPTQPNHSVLVGIVTRQHVTLGAIEIVIENGEHLTDLHDVLINNPLNNNALVYETASTLWKNKVIDKIFVGLGNVDNTSDINKPVSTATQNAIDAKLGLSGGTLTGALNEANIVTLSSATNVNIVNIASNTAYITGNTAILTFTAGTSGMIRRLQFEGSLILQGGNNIRLPNFAATLTTTAKDVATFVYTAIDSKWYCVSYTRGSASNLTANRLTYFNGTDIVTTNHIIGNDGNNITWVNDAFQSFGPSSNYLRGGTNTGIKVKAVNNAIDLNFNDTARLLVQPAQIQMTGATLVFRNYDASVYFGIWTSGGLLIGSGGTINSSAILQVDSTTKGFLPPRMTTAQRTNASLNVKGMIVYDTDLNGLYQNNGSTWSALGGASYLTGTWTPNTSYGGTTRNTITVTVTGATVGSRVVANINDAMRADFVTAGSWFLDMQAYVSSTNTVSITFVMSTSTTFGATSSINLTVN